MAEENPNVSGQFESCPCAKINFPKGLALMLLSHGIERDLTSLSQYRYFKFILIEITEALH